MTQEEKELLLRDLSARLPYGVEVDYKEYTYDIRHWKIDSLHSPAYSESGILINTDYEGWINFTEYEGCGMSTGSRPLHIEKNLPFLRPMSSMTEEERNEYLSIKMQETERVALAEVYRPEAISEIMDWLNKHHFDYRGLIEKGLALEAPKGMYK
jgi:hypothetical protein